MTSIKRAVGIGIACAAILASGMVSASTASASVGDERCGSADGGVLCIHEYSNGYNVWFKNNTYQAKHVDFILQCNDPSRPFAPIGDPGAFWSMPWATNSYFFSINRVYACSVVLKDLQSNIAYKSAPVYAY
ncbi:hypothetical protein ACFXKJ_41455 [Kitasatospora indigofera]|uniref:hypothetical protein n=1 Tax=Kitasatospora indigofera TaxID=67307 RepID=UPI00367BC1EE